METEERLAPTGFHCAGSGRIQDGHVEQNMSPCHQDLHPHGVENGLRRRGPCWGSRSEEAHPVGKQTLTEVCCLEAGQAVLTGSPRFSCFSVKELKVLPPSSAHVLFRCQHVQPGASRSGAKRRNHVNPSLLWKCQGGERRRRKPGRVAQAGTAQEQQQKPQQHVPLFVGLCDVAAFCEEFSAETMVS